jgi:hypothetical protein
MRCLQRRSETMALFSSRGMMRGLLLAMMLSAGSDVVRADGVAVTASQGDAAKEAVEFPAARAVADEVLKRPEFKRDVEDTWWEHKKDQILKMVLNGVERVNRLGKAAPWLAKTVEWTLFGGAAVGLLIYLLRQMRRQRLHMSLGDNAVKAEAWTREASDWSERATAYAHAGEWRDAVHCLYWAAIVLLESRRAWRHNPTRTPREYVRLLKAGSAQQQGLRGLTQIFERTWYGLRETDAEEYARARELYEGLMSSASSGSDERVDARAVGAEAL